MAASVIVTVPLLLPVLVLVLVLQKKIVSGLTPPGQHLCGRVHRLTQDELAARRAAVGAGQHALVDVAGQALRVAVDARQLAPGAAVLVGVRPEHLLVGNGAAPDASPLPAQQQHRERLGDSSLLYVSAGGGLPLAHRQGRGQRARRRRPDDELAATGGRAAPVR